MFARCQLHHLEDYEGMIIIEMIMMKMFYSACCITKLQVCKIAFSLPQFTSFFADEDTTKPLNILHDIISKFDQLMYEAQFNRIEKIKIIQSTFMAACGLLSGI